MPPKGAQQRYEKKQQERKIVGQLNQLYGAGYTADQIRAAGPNAWRQFSQDGEVVKPTDLTAPAGFSPAGTSGFTPTQGYSQGGGLANPADANANSFIPSSYDLSARGRGYTERNTPAGRSGLSGAGQPAWWQTLIAPENRATGGGAPAWLSSVPSWLRGMVEPGLMGLSGLASQVMPLPFAGATSPLIAALMNRTTAAQGSRTSSIGGRSISGPGTLGARIPAPAEEAAPSYNSGYGGSRYRRSRRGGGGGGGYSDYEPYQRPQYAQAETPAWLSGLANWSIG